LLPFKKLSLVNEGESRRRTINSGKGFSKYSNGKDLINSDIFE
jgi:hypothetical protein